MVEPSKSRHKRDKINSKVGGIELLSPLPSQNSLIIKQKIFFNFLHFIRCKCNLYTGSNNDIFLLKVHGTCNMFQTKIILQF